MSIDVLRAEKAVIRAWVMLGGQTRKNEPLMLSSDGCDQVARSVSKHMAGEKILAVFSGSAFFLIRSAGQAMATLGDDGLLVPDMKVASMPGLDTLWVDKFVRPLLKCSVGFHDLQDDLAQRAGGLEQVRFDALRSVALSRVRIAAGLFHTTLCELVRQSAFIALSQGMTEASILVVCQSPLLNTLSRLGQNCTLFSPADMVRSDFVVPLQLGAPVSHLDMGAIAGEIYLPCPPREDEAS